MQCSCCGNKSGSVKLIPMLPDNLCQRCLEWAGKIVVKDLMLRGGGKLWTKD